MMQSIKVLLAEDNYPDALYFRQLLDRSRVHYDLKICEDGDEALVHLLDCAMGKQAAPDIIMLDINLPKRSGLEVLSEIRANPKLQDLSVVIVSGSDDPGDLKRANELQASYIQKPADFEKLCAVLSVIENAYFVVDNAPQRSEKPDMDTDVKTASTAMGKVEYLLLLVEDSPHDTRLVQQLLSISTDTRFKVEAVSDLASAINLAEQRVFDVIALDLGLPDSVGLDGFFKLQLHCPDTPIVITTGSDEQELGREAVMRGAQDYIVKNAQNYGELFTRSLKYAIHRKRAENLAKGSLMREHHVLQQALEKAPIFIIRIDKKMKIIDVNSTTELELRRDRASLMGQTIAELIPDIDRGDLSRLLNDGVPFRNQGQQISRTGERLRQETYWDVLAWPVQGREQAVNEAIIIGIDVSEKVRAEQQRDEFVQTLAHDIKNPVLGEHRVLTVLLERYANEIQPSAVAGGLHAILKSNESLIHMLTNLLEAYKIETNLYRPTIVSVKIEELVSRAVLELATLLTMNRIKVITELDESIGTINGDPIALQRLLMNILHNAAQHTPSEGEIRIFTKGHENDIYISIANTGPGIQAEDIKLLFQRFAPASRGKRRVQSSGLGLYICRKIVEAHHGKITVHSEPDKLTTFTIKLPVRLPSESFNDLPSMASLRNTFII